MVPGTPVSDESDRPGAIRVGVALATGPRIWSADGEAVALLDRAERGGIDVVWIDGRPPAREHDAIQCAAAAAALTRRVEIAVDGLSWPPQSWLRAAEDLASLDALSGGRIQVAVRLAPDATLDDALEDLDLVRSAWAEGAIDHRSARQRVDGVDVHPKPARPGGPRLWVSADTASTERAFELALRAGIGLLLDAAPSAGSLRRLASARASRGQRAGGLPIALRGPASPGAVVPDALRARAEAAWRRLGAVASSLDWIEPALHAEGPTSGDSV